MHQVVVLTIKDNLEEWLFKTNIKVFKKNLFFACFTGIENQCSLLEVLWVVEMIVVVGFLVQRFPAYH